MTIEEILTKINISESNDGAGSDASSSIFEELYGGELSDLQAQKNRYRKAVESFSSIFPEDTDISIFSAPGRTEICGNHTDHQHGCVLAAAVDLDTIAVVSFTDKKVIRVQSEGYPFVEVDLADLSMHEEEKGTTASLIRGVMAQFSARGVEISGFDAYVTSDVLSGSGLSSSAAFEVLMGTITDIHDNDGKAGPAEVARFGQIAENQYFGKASGLMDQTVSAVGGLVEIDFLDTENPVIRKHKSNLNRQWYGLVITDTKGSHANLSGEYSAIPEEMRSVARFFGKDYLRQVEEKTFFESMADLKKCPEISDRAILRSAHFFADNARVRKEAEALEKNDFQCFLRLVNESGDSSALYLQNLSCSGNPGTQEIPLALMLSRRVLGENGACRVHGGGFAGTIQAFVPFGKVNRYIDTLEAVFGAGACHLLRVRNKGAFQVF